MGLERFDPFCPLELTHAGAVVDNGGAGCIGCTAGATIDSSGGDGDNNASVRTPSASPSDAGGEAVFHICACAGGGAPRLVSSTLVDFSLRVRGVMRTGSTGESCVAREACGRA